MNPLGGFADHYNRTVLHPVGIITVLVLGVALVLLPRRYAIVPMVILACFIPVSQRIILLSADFTLLRILVLFAWVRILFRSEFHGIYWNGLDSMIVAWKISGTIVFTLAYGEQWALINRLGWVFDGFGMYFFFRCVIRDWQDLDRLISFFILISVPVAVAFCVERATGRNVFSVFGGVPAITVVREGKLRCQGAYAHAILAGCFWASLLPFIIAHFVEKRSWVVSGAFFSILIVIINCSSSTPILGVCFAILGMTLYVFRAYTRILRWGFLILLIVLHFSMEAPVWHLLSRVNVVGGSTGWWRYKIMDATINNFSEWWFLGETNPMGWGVMQMRDITNQYILEALRGGMLTLLCYVVMFGVAFGMVGRSLCNVRQHIPQRELLVWSIGASLFTHVCIFFAVSYFGQINMLVYLNLAMIGCLPSIHRRQMEQLQPGG